MFTDLKVVEDDKTAQVLQSFIYLRANATHQTVPRSGAKYMCAENIRLARILKSV